MFHVIILRFLILGFVISHLCTINANEIKIKGEKFEEFGIGESRVLIFNPSAKIYAHGSEKEFANHFTNSSVLVRGGITISEV